MGRSARRVPPWTILQHQPEIAFSLQILPGFFIGCILGMVWARTGISYWIALGISVIAIYAFLKVQKVGAGGLLFTALALGMAIGFQMPRAFG